MRKFLTWSLPAFLAFLVLQPSHSLARVPVRDRAKNAQLSQSRQNILDSVKTRAGTSKSTAGVKCSWGVSPENALSQRADVASKIASTCASLGVDPAFALSIAYQESRFNQHCIAPTTPHSGGERAQGVMQVLPKTGQRMFSEAGLGTYNGANEDQNIKAGCLYLAEGKKIANGSAYHIAGGYHAGYGSNVWRDNLKIPAGWPKTLDYAETVTKRWYPFFSRGLQGYSGGRYASDQLQANGVLSGINGIEALTGDQARLAARLDEQGRNIGQFDTERLEWVQNSRVRLLNGQATNSFVEALTLLAEFKMLALSLNASDTSETAVLVKPTPVKPVITDPNVIDIIWDENEQRWKVLNKDGSWSWLEANQTDARIVVGQAQATKPAQPANQNADNAAKAQAAAIARITHLLDQ